MNYVCRRLKKAATCSGGMTAVNFADPRCGDKTKKRRNCRAVARSKRLLERTAAIVWQHYYGWKGRELRFGVFLPGAVG